MKKFKAGQKLCGFERKADRVFVTDIDIPNTIFRIEVFELCRKRRYGVGKHDF